MSSVSALSSQASVPPASQPTASPFTFPAPPSPSRHNLHRRFPKTAPLAFELREQCSVYLEECLYIQALRLLESTLAGSLAHVDQNAQASALLAPTQHLALLLTLTIHPSMTTRAKMADAVQASNLALRYLGQVLQTVGPQAAQFSKAFAFPFADSSQHRRGTTRRQQQQQQRRLSDHGQDRHLPMTATSDEPLNSAWAREKSLFACAGDFWSAIGWAFNCSHLHPRRWERWRLWIDFMVDVLEQDWANRNAETYSDSILADYLGIRGVEPTGHMSIDAKRLVRACFANGTPTSVAEFGPIWRHETSDASAAREKPDMQNLRLNLNEEEYADYLDGSSSSDSEDNNDPGSYSKRERRGRDQDSPEKTEFRDGLPSPDETDTMAPLGGSEAASLRLRMMALLISMASNVPDVLPPMRSFLDIFLTQIRALPLRTFTTLISPASLGPTMGLAMAAFVIRALCHTLLEGRAGASDLSQLDQGVLEEHYLPWSASTHGIVENVKAAFCIESLVRLYDMHVGLRWSPELEAAALTGTERRRERAQRQVGRKGEAGTRSSGAADQEMLRQSSERLMFVIRSARL